MEIDNITLASIYKRKKTDRDIFQELMPTKVKEVLLVATLYDSYTIVREGQFSDKIFGEYLQLNLYAAPRFTSVNSAEDALLTLEHTEFDLIIEWPDWIRMQQLKPPGRSVICVQEFHCCCSPTTIPTCVTS